MAAGGRSAIIRTPAENDAAVAAVVAAGVDFAWIGLSDAVTSDEFVFAWAEDIPLGSYNAWADGQPSATPIWKDCVRLDASTGKWANRACDQNLMVVCVGGGNLTDNALVYARSPGEGVGDSLDSPTVCDDEAACMERALAACLTLGKAGTVYPNFAGDYLTKGCYYYEEGPYAGAAYFGRGGTAEQEAEPNAEPNAGGLKIRLLCDTTTPSFCEEPTSAAVVTRHSTSAAASSSPTASTARARGARTRRSRCRRRWRTSRPPTRRSSSRLLARCSPSTRRRARRSGSCGT